MIIPFPDKPHVVVTRRQVLETKYETSAGTEVVQHKPPVEMYFLEYHDEGGFACCVWDGTSHLDALAAARSWAAEGIAVRDRTEQSQGRA